ncbi:MAG: hypothetical protein LIO53_06300 [Oscillospiraceae bacterium]|nr:hypothetical protein [Oscillospiraceae bacterium]
MNNVKFYNMHGINCWIINLKPFDSKTTSGAEIRGFQERCVEARVFGIGRRTDYFERNPKAVLEAETKK